MPQEQYLLSFTAGGLLISESMTVLDIYLQLNDWKQTRSVVSDDNALQSRTVSTTNRKFREIKARLETLTTDQLQLLSAGSSEEQVALLWLAACKRYRFLRDFSRDVIHEKYLTLDLQISTADAERFIQNQMIWHAELEKITDSTQQKIRTVALRMLREANLVDDSQLIQPSILSSRLVQSIVDENPEWLTIFPIAPKDIPLS